MKVKEIRIQNILGIEDLSITPGALTVITGRNAAGKTSVLTAIKDLAEGGHDPTLIRNGCEWGQVGLMLDDGVTITKKITPEKSTTVVKHPKFGKISRPQQWIHRVLDGLSLDPVQFLTVNAKDRLGILLSALDLKLEAGDLREILPAGSGYANGIDLDRHALEVLGEVKAKIYSDRREINVRAKEKRATVSQMEETLPEAPEGADWQTELEELTTQREEVEAAHRERVDDLKNAAAMKIEAARKGMEGNIEILRFDFEQAQETIRAEQAKETTAIAEDCQPTLTALNEQIGKATARIEAEGKAKQTREMIERFTGEANELDQKSVSLTMALGRLDALKAELLHDIPIEGLEIDDGEIKLGGIPFDRLNDAEKHRLAVEVGKLKAGELGLLLIDRGEIFDADSWRSFTGAATMSGLQIIAARVSDEPLKVSSSSSAEGKAKKPRGRRAAAQ